MLGTCSPGESTSLDLPSFGLSPFPVVSRRGSFKFRGACNSIFSLSDEDARRGVVTHSRQVLVIYLKAGVAYGFGVAFPLKEMKVFTGTIRGLFGNSPA
jgi:hypothetical protein